MNNIYEIMQREAARGQRPPFRQIGHIDSKVTAATYRYSAGLSIADRRDPVRIQSIETRYKGIKFRSRLEAKVAEELDRIGIGWEYEVEGYQLGDVWYLPDFWIKSLRLFIEVKGILDDSVEKPLLLSQHMPVIIVESDLTCSVHFQDEHCVEGASLSEVLGDVDSALVEPDEADSALTAELTPGERRLLARFAMLAHARTQPIRAHFELALPMLATPMPAFKRQPAFKRPRFRMPPDRMKGIKP